jgi:hypothetical protein
MFAAVDHVTFLRPPSDFVWSVELCTTIVRILSWGSLAVRSWPISEIDTYCRSVRCSACKELFWVRSFYIHLLVVQTDSMIKSKKLMNMAIIARYTTKHKIHDLVTPLLRDLHWLIVSKRISFRLAVLVCHCHYHCQHGLAPPLYLADELHHVTGIESRQRLRSASTMAMVVPSSNRSNNATAEFYSISTFSEHNPSINSNGIYVLCINSI